MSEIGQKVVARLKKFTETPEHGEETYFSCHTLIKLLPDTDGFWWMLTDDGWKPIVVDSDKTRYYTLVTYFDKIEPGLYIKCQPPSDVDENEQPYQLRRKVLGLGPDNKKRWFTEVNDDLVGYDSNEPDKLIIIRKDQIKVIFDPRNTKSLSDELEQADMGGWAWTVIDEETSKM